MYEFQKRKRRSENFLFCPLLVMMLTEKTSEETVVKDKEEIGIGLTDSTKNTLMQCISRCQIFIWKFNIQFKKMILKLQYSNFLKD